MNNLVLIRLKSVYGRTLAYPANTPAELLAGIAGEKTLSYSTLKGASDLGFRFRVVTQNWEADTSLKTITEAIS